MTSTIRSIRAGYRCANTSPGTAPQSCATSFTRSMPSSSSSRRQSGVALDRVIEVAALARAAETAQVGRDSAGPLQERRPSHRSWSGCRGGRAAGSLAAGRTPVEDGRPGEFDRVLVDAHPRARITSPSVSEIRTGEPAPPTRTLCLGEALVDLICEQPRRGRLAEADAFVPHFGGAVANVAMVAARGRRQRRPRRGGRRRSLGPLAPRASGGSRCRHLTVRPRARRENAGRDRRRQRRRRGALPDLRRADRDRRARAVGPSRGGGP